MNRLVVPLILGAAPSLFAQISGPPGALVFVTADPAGSCANRQAMQYNPLTGSLWGCKTGTWNAVGGAGGSTSPGSPVGSVQTNQGGAFTGDANFLWDPTGKTLRINGGTGSILEFGEPGYVNGGIYNGNPADNTAANCGGTADHGGWGCSAYSDGTGADGTVSLAAYLSGSPASPAANKPLIYFTTFTDDQQALKGSTLFAVDNDFRHDLDGQYALQLIEKHGTVSGGFPDSVGFLGINTTTPGAVLHALNPTTANDDAPKNYVVSLTEGRADQVADLAQWKKTGGSTLAKIAKDGTFLATAVYSAVNTVAFSATPTFDASLGNSQKITLTGNVTSSTLSNLVAGEGMNFQVCQDGSGSHTFVWPTNVKGPVTIGSTASKCSMQSFMSFDGSNLYATSTGVTNQ